jgi:hypothetical protein
VASVHPTLQVDGLVAVSPPPGWTVDIPGPPHVSMSHPDGRRLLTSRLADTTDIGVATQQAITELLAVVPDAAVGAFEPVGAAGSVSSFEAPFTGTVLAVPHDGMQRLWVDGATGAVFSFIALHPVGGPWSELDRDFVLDPLDRSITSPR